MTLNLCKIFQKYNLFFNNIVTILIENLNLKYKPSDIKIFNK
jgi:hypothetical protein